jgi:hypothetical protein
VAWSSTAIAGAELAAWNEDKPILVGFHAIRDVAVGGSTGIWATTQDTGAADRTETGFETFKAGDGLLTSTATTKPDAALNTWYYNIALASPIEIDCFLIAGPNIATAGVVDVVIADNSTFTTRAITVAYFTSAASDRDTKGRAPVDSDRLFVGMSEFPASANWDRFSGVSYVSVRINGIGPMTPEVSEIWLGRRYQTGGVNSPTAIKRTRSNTESAPTSIGAIGSRPVGIGQAVRDASITTGNESTTERDGYLAWWSDIDNGARSFLWVEEPATDPRTYSMTVPPSFDYKLDGPHRRTLDLPMIESAPFFSAGGI